MIYLISGQINNVVTDSILTHIPSTVGVTLDGEQLGEYTNISTNQQLINILLPINETTDRREYHLNFYDRGILFKTELAVVRTQIGVSFSAPSTTKKYKTYER